MAEAGPAEAAEPQATGAPSISLPKGGGAIRGIGERFSANPATGTASFSVPVTVSQGRGGFGPRLSLSYDSGYGNGPCGFGWRLSREAIARRTDRGLPRYEDAAGADTFMLAGGAELVRAAAAPGERLGHRVERFRQEVEREPLRVERWTRFADGDVHWRTISKDDVLTVFGLDASSRVADPERPDQVFEWLACHSYDDKGNAIVYEYAAEDAAGVDLSRAAEQRRQRGANRYLKRIRYGNRVPLLIDPATPSFRRPHLPAPDFEAADCMFEVVLDYGEGHYSEEAADGQGRVFATAAAEAPADSAWPVRRDSFSSYRAGFEVRTHRLCRRLLNFHRFPDELGADEVLVRSTELDYVEKPTGSFVSGVVQSGFRRRDDGRYLKRSLPPLELRYSESPLEDPGYEGEDVRELDAESLANLPVALDTHHDWVDLDGEGIPGLLSREDGGWYYKPNLGAGRLGPAEPLEAKPALAEGSHLLPLDLAGDGTLDLVNLEGPAAGFSAHAEDGGFEPFRAFASAPSVAQIDTGARLVDVVGDGLADLLAADGDCLYWQRSLGKEGFGEALRLDLTQDEAEGPRVLFADREHSIFLADLSGDGLSDVVRVREGEVCYWPNLGYGRFGAKVTMDGAPTLGPPELFDPRRVRLFDSDGSGTADLLYVGADAVRVYLNLSGNSWSEPRVLRTSPAANGATSLTAVDLMGRGTACLVWSSALPGEVRSPVRYLDLCDGVKPNLLVEVRNNLGAETRIAYSPSTKFYLEDKAAGRPWATRLPFPVQVVERIDTVDRVGRNRYVSRYRYHHGYFDGERREFRGFGRVEQLDTEELAALSGSEAIPDAANVDVASYSPPVLTKMWFHTGSRASLRSEYSGGERAELDLPVGLSPAEAAAARAALTGSPLRLEVYGLDGSPLAERPYLVRELGYGVSRLEPGVFLPHPRETIELEYDRAQPADPRVSHRLDLAVDDYGNPLLTASVAYGRLAGAPADPLLTAEDVEIQRTPQASFVEAVFTNEVSEADAGRAPLECEQKTFELRNASPAAEVFRPQELAALIEAAGDGSHELPYEDSEGDGVSGSEPFRRLIEHVRTVYRANDLSAALPLGGLQALALPEASYRLAFTPALAKATYVSSGKLSAAELKAAMEEGGYVHSEDDAGWWLPSSRVAYSPGAADTPAQELAVAAAHFFLPRRFLDPFGNGTRLDFDDHDLLPARSTDPLGNRIEATNDYRVLEPALVVDPNGNRSAAAYSALGEVAGTALMGKEGEDVGDSLAGFEPDLPPAVEAAHLADPLADPAGALGRATSRCIVSRTAEPPVTYTIAREVHDSDLEPGEASPLQQLFSYSDGFGHEVQKKRFAGDDGWLTSGWSILDNKGRRVRHFEPFLDESHAFRFHAAVGVSSIHLRDPLGREVALAHPHKAWEKASAGPWRGESWDGNDTALLDPKTDADVGRYFSRLADVDYLPTWYDQRQGGGLGAAEQEAAEKTALHSGTPTLSFRDPRGRVFLTVAHNRFRLPAAPPETPPAEERLRTLVVLDAEDNERRLVDPLGRICARYAYDMVGNRVNVATMENGERWLLCDVRGKPLLGWDSRGHRFETTYDALRRPLTRSVRGSDAERSDPRTLGGEVLFEKLEYGEGMAEDSAHNLRTRLVRARDGAGVVTSDRFDYKGNCLRRTQQLLEDYEALADWSGEPALEAESFVNQTSYDALNRAATITTPDGSVARVGYDPVDRLASLEVNVRGAATATAFVRSVAYNARGERTRIEYGNGSRSDYEYDPLTFRLSRQRTTRPGGNGFAERLFADAGTLQDLRYTYDPVGNPVRIADAALRTVVSEGQPVKPEFPSAYDALYRLIEASGREQTEADDVAAARSYSERFQYDAAGNLVHLAHRASGGNWQRDYEYAEPSQLEPAKTSNRLTRAPVGGEAATAFGYDAHGCTTRMPQLPLARWDFKDQLVAASRQVAEDPETVFCSYAMSGARIRKVVRRQSGTRRSERIYLLNAEVYREFAGDGTTEILRRDSLQVMDDRQRIALVETVPGSQPATRYQLANYLGSACLELDASAAVISYEEYGAFGQTTVFGGSGAAEVSLKRYRYSGKERDEETGLSYHGARYYASWLGRWTSCDPEAFSLRRSRPGAAPERASRPSPGWNPYAYARDNPYLYNDPSGRLDQKTIATLVALAPTGGLLVTAGVLAIYDATQTHGPEDKRWVSSQEGGLFDWWTFGHYLLPASIGLLVTLALDKLAPSLSPEAIYAISGMTAATIAWVYEVFERPLWSSIHKWTGAPSRLSSTTPVLGWADRLAHNSSKDAALEWQTNTVGDVMIGTLGAFTFSYLYLLHFSSHGPVNPEFAIGFAAFGEMVAFVASVELVYGDHIPTRDTHYYDPVHDEFHRRQPQAPHSSNDHLDPSYSPFETALA
jgi:RHS repeat-associated protein